MLLGLLAALPLAAGAEGRANRRDVLSAAAIKPGMKGYGLTVFEGTEPSRFEVEVIDVLRNFRPRQDLILVKTEHPRLEVAKVVAGMSGSPIYIDGKMIGAYAYGWTFGAEPVAGVTPIRNMLDDLERPLPDFINGWPLTMPRHVPHSATSTRGETHQASNRYRGTAGTYNLLEHRDQLAAAHQKAGGAALPGLTPVSTPLLMGGMAAGSIEFAGDLLAPLGLVPLAGGGAGAPEADAPTRFVDGGAVGVQLVRGDMSAMGLGTVTRVEGDRLVAFGHPMMNAGVTAMPTAVGRVLWFLASQARSFKLGMPVRSMGAMVNDRQASIVVSQTAKAPIIPVTVAIEGVPGAPDTHWNFELAHEKFTTPSLIAVALGNALQTTAAERQDVTWRAESRVKIQGQRELLIDDFGVSVGGTPDEREFSRSGLVDAIGSVFSNPWEPAFVERVDVRVNFEYRRDLLRLRGAELLTPEVEPGERARVRLTLLPYEGEPVLRTVTFQVPKHLAGKSVKLQIEPGYAVAREKAPPESLTELVDGFRNPHYPPQAVVVSYEVGAGVAFRGHVAHNLPSGVVDAFNSTSNSIEPSRVSSWGHHSEDLGRYMIGKETLLMQVKAVQD